MPAFRIPVAAILLLGLAACSGDSLPFGEREPAQGASAPAKPARLAGGPAAAAPANPATNIDFGDDKSNYSRDGECDDKRFAGDGMTETPLLKEDIGHDATDCRTAFNQGRLTLASDVKPAPNAAADRIQWGDDDSKFALDGECDDKRFTGPGMTDTPLLASDIKHDATDCRAEFVKGLLRLRE